jgi:hypothetical protein
MKELFHGTNNISAVNIMGPPLNVDVKMGKGELGRGFYLGEEPCLAGTWARNRYGQNASVLEFNVDNARLVSLTTEQITRRKLVLRKWNKMKKSGNTDKFLFNVDLVIAPFALLEFSHQYKFESMKAQQVINNSTIKKIL